MLNLKAGPHSDDAGVVVVTLGDLYVAVRPQRAPVEKYAPMIAAAFSVCNSPGMLRGSVNDWWIEDAKRRSEIAKQLTPFVAEALAAYKGQK